MMYVNRSLNNVYTHFKINKSNVELVTNCVVFVVSRKNLFICGENSHAKNNLLKVFKQLIFKGNFC